MSKVNVLGLPVTMVSTMWAHNLLPGSCRQCVSAEFINLKVFSAFGMSALGNVHIEPNYDFWLRLGQSYQTESFSSATVCAGLFVINEKCCFFKQYVPAKSTGLKPKHKTVT